MTFLFLILITFIPFCMLFIILKDLMFGISISRMEKAINNVLELHGYYSGSRKEMLKKKLMMYYFIDNINNYRKIEKRLKQIERGEI